MKVKRLDPPGARSCRRKDGGAGPGGEWKEAKALLAEGGLRAHMAECLRGLHPHVRNFMFAEIQRAMVEAAMGRLNLARGDDPGEVKVMASRPRVLEICFNRQIDPSGSGRNIRLYYTEPQHESVLLALALEWKADHPAGLKEQNRHIRMADKRIDQHYN